MRSLSNRPLIFLATIFIPLAAYALLPRGDSSDLIDQAKHSEPEKSKAFLADGGKVVPTSDNKSFYIYLPPKGDAPVVMSLHGHGTYAFDDYSAWASQLKKRGYGYLGLQWWLGQGDDNRDYYLQYDLYRELEYAIHKEDLSKHKILLHGFSRGSANIYGVAAFDHETQKHFFPVILANAGGASRDFPANQAINNDRFGKTPFEDTQWILFCGGKDPHPDRDGCPGMERTKTWIESKGGKVGLFIQDPAAGHGGFHMNPANSDKALDFFEKLTPPKK